MFLQLEMLNEITFVYRNLKFELKNGISSTFPLLGQPATNQRNLKGNTEV